MWIEETKNGKYKAVERYTDYITGKTKKISVTMEKNTAQSRKVAQNVLDERIRRANEATTNENIRLCELVDKYREDQRLTVKMSTYQTNYHACNTLVDILGRSTLVGRMTAQYVRGQLLATKKGPGTLNRQLTRFKALIRWGYHNDYVEDISFIDKLEPFKDAPHKIKIQDKYLESGELKTLIDGMSVTVWGLLTEFLALSGLRVGEAVALEKSDIDYDAKYIHVTKTYDCANKVSTAPKTATSIRDVFMQDELVSVCRKINALMLRQKIMCGYSKTPLFLASKNGQHISYCAYNKYLKDWSHKTIGRAITVHALRHTHASLLMEHGVSVDSISRRLGHDSSQITREIYLHVTEKLKGKDNEQIAQVKIM